MPEAAAAEPAAADAANDGAAAVIDDELHAAEQTRTTAKWIASALGAIPGIAVLGSLIRAPGDQGFNQIPLLLGIGFVAVGAGLILYLFADVIRPAAIGNATLANFDVSRVPGAPEKIGTGGHRGRDLLDEIERTRSTVGAEERRITAATVASKFAEARAATLEAKALQLEAVAKSTGLPPAQKAADLARLAADVAKAEATNAGAMLAAQQAAAAAWTTQFSRLNHIRTNAVLLASADVVRERFSTALTVMPIGLLAVGIGIWFLAVSPIAKPASTNATATSLVRLTLTDKSRDALGCSADSVDAMNLGESENATTLITLPSSECPTPVALKFPIGARSGPFGSFEIVDPVPPPTPAPTPVPTAAPTPTSSGAKSSPSG